MTEARPPKRKHSVRAALGWTMLGGGAQSLMQLLSTIVLARLLSPTEFGLVAATASLTAIVMIFSEILFAPALIQRAEITPQYISTACLLSVVVAGLLSLGFSLLAGDIAGWMAMETLEPVIQALAIAMFVQGASAIPEALMMRRFQFKHTAAIESLSYGAAYFLVAIPLALLGMGVWALVLAAIARTLIRYVWFAWLTADQTRFGFDRASARDILTAGGGFSLARIQLMVATQADHLIVGRFLGAAQLGLYDRAYLLMKMPANMFNKLTGGMLLASLSRLQDDTAKLRAAYIKSVQILALAGMALSAITFSAAREITLTLLGPNWISMSDLLAILSLAMYPRLGQKLATELLQARGKVYRNSAYQSVHAGLVIGGALAAVQFGVAAVAMAVAAAATVHFLVISGAALRELGIGWMQFLRLHLAPFCLFVFLLMITMPGHWLARHFDSAIAGMVLIGLCWGCGLLAAAASRSQLLLGEHGALFIGQVMGALLRRGGGSKSGQGR